MCTLCICIGDSSVLCNICNTPVSCTGINVMNTHPYSISSNGGGDHEGDVYQGNCRVVS